MSTPRASSAAQLLAQLHTAGSRESLSQLAQQAHSLLVAVEQALDKLGALGQRAVGAHRVVKRNLNVLRRGPPCACSAVGGGEVLLRGGAQQQHEHPPTSCRPWPRRRCCALTLHLGDGSPLVALPLVHPPLRGRGVAPLHPLEHRAVLCGRRQWGREQRVRGGGVVRPAAPAPPPPSHHPPPHPPHPPPQATSPATTQPTQPSLHTPYPLHPPAR